MKNKVEETKVKTVDYCVICNHELRRQIEQDIAGGVYTKGTIATELDIPIEMVWQHMNEHFGEGKVNAIYKDHSSMDETILDNLYGKKKVLQDLMMDAADRMNALKEMDKMTPVDTNNIIKTAGMLIKAVELLARLEGELNEEQRVTIQMYMTMKSVVIEAVTDCPHCKAMIVENLAAIEKKVKKVIDVKATEIKQVEGMASG